MVNCFEYLIIKYYICINGYKWMRLISLMKISIKWVDVLIEIYRM